MTTKLETFIQPYLKKDLPEIRSGDIVRVYQKIKEGDPSTPSTGSGQASSGQVKERI